MDNKGQANLETVGKVAIVVLTLAVLGVVSLLILSIMSGNSVVPQSTLSGRTINETAWFNSSGYSFASRTVLGFANPVIVTAINGTSGAVIPSTDYTINGQTVYNLTAKVWNPVNMTYTYGYNTQTANDAISISNNVSSGNTTFFTNVPTVFTVLGVAMIIGIIGLIVFAVRRLNEKSNSAYA